MERRSVLFIFSLFFCLAVSSFSERPFLPVTKSHETKQAVFTFQAKKPVKGELQRVSQPASAGSGAVYREQVDPSVLPQPAVMCSRSLAKKSSLRRIASSPVKDYLSQIYPSHNFW